jgi:hypothetical protein
MPIAERIRNQEMNECELRNVQPARLKRKAIKLHASVSP